MGDRYRFGAAELDAGRRQFLLEGRPVPLGGRAFDLLVMLARNAERVVTKEELYEAVWPGVAVQPNNLQVHVWTLRRLLGSAAIATVARRGYRLMLPVQREGRNARPVVDQLTACLLDKLRVHRLLTLTGADAVQRRTVAHAVAQAHRTLHGPWIIESADADPAGAVARRVLGELARHGGLLVVHDAQASAALTALTGQAFAARPDARLLVTARSPLGLPQERSVCLEPQPEEAYAPGAVLRWDVRRAARPALPA